MTKMTAFILSLSQQQSSVQPEPEPEQFPLVFGDSVVTLTGAQTLFGVLTGTHNLYWPRAIYHEGKTYHLAHGIYQSEGLGQAHLLVYDEKRGLLRPYRVSNAQILNPDFGVPDSHTVPSIQIDNDGNIFVFQERTHDTPIDIYKGEDFNKISFLSEKINPGSGATAQSSYHNIMKLPDGNGWSWCRMTKLYEAYSGAHGASVSASDGFESWGSLVRNTTNPRPDTSPSGSETDRTRHYPHLPYYRQIVTVGGEDYIVCLRTQRVDNPVNGLGIWHKYYIHLTPVGTGRGVIFKNLVGTEYTQDTSSSNYMDETDLDTNFKYHDSGSEANNSFIPVSTVSLHPKVFIVTGDAHTGDLLLHIIDIPTRAQVTKNLNISGYTVYDPDSKQSHAVRHIAYIEDGGYLEIGIEIDYPSSVIKTHLFRSYDLGDTFIDMGDVTPELSTSATLITFPINYLDIPANRNFSVTLFTPDGTTSNTLVTYVKRAAKGAIQTETPDIIVPASDYSDANDLFHYVATDGNISRSGNNVTGLTDQFGIRNATGVNNPQWDGVDAISLNGTNQVFTIATTGLTALSQITFMAIVKMTGATNKILFSLNDNTVATAFLAFLGHDINVSAPSVVYKEASVISLRDHGQDSINTDEWALVSFVMDGRCKSDIYPNGKKQFYQTTNYTTLAHFTTRGKLNYGTVNSVRIGGLDGSGTDTFSAFSFKAFLAKNTVYDYETFRALEKKFANDHGITLNYGYQ